MGKFDFSKVGGAQMSERGEPLTPNVRYTGAKDEKGNALAEKHAANFELEITRCIAKRSRAGKDLFIAEARVCASDNVEHPVGAKRTWIQDMGIDAGPGALKGFCVAALGIDHRSAEGKDAIQELAKPIIVDADLSKKCGLTIGETTDKFSLIMQEALEDATDPACKNGFAGTKVLCEVKEIDTKPKTKGGDPGKFNLHTFSPFTEKK